ncbi:MAG: lysophospholipid acyltransferase family protein [Verrucomicrobiae bacterium]|nr:lysophospholipid acyltransferase family protein [Verrucomicrobiae bacterium]
MDLLLYILARILFLIIMAVPLKVVARLGRIFGTIAYTFDKRHRRVAIKNLTMCFPEKTAEEIKRLAKENFKRIGENFLSATKTMMMTKSELVPHVEFVGVEKLENALRKSENSSVVVAIGHFGNFELYARFGEFSNGIKCATTYRALNQKKLNNFVQNLRERSGCLYFERRTDASKLQQTLRQGSVVLGLLADQHAGDKGLRLPFFGHDCSTSAAPAVYALRYKCPLFVAICYRIDLAKWRIEINGPISTEENGKKRDVSEICSDINKLYEHAIRRDPANWFWVHNRWKPPPKKT